MPDPATPPTRPLGLSIVAALCAIFGLQSIMTAVRLFPEWLAAARQHNYTSMSFTWISLTASVTGFAAAYGLWYGRRWARIPFVASALIVVATVGFITMFAIGEVGGPSGWVTGVVLVVITIIVAAVLVRYVWRST
jgi:hypothetical protein